MTAWRLNRSAFALVAVGVVASLTAPEARAQLPPTGPVSSYQGAPVSGQCVPAGRSLANVVLKRDLPQLGTTNNGAARFWEISLPGWSKITNDGKKLPPARACMIVWSSSLPKSGGAGHIAHCIGTVDPNTRTVRVVDSNWVEVNKGAVHDVKIDGYVLGWIVPN